MSFKKTAEGRIYFQTDSNNRFEKNGPLTQKTNSPNGNGAARPAPGAGQSQSQIIALLKSLNTRLHNTQVEREAMQKQLERYEDMINRLEEKAQRSENAYRNLAQAMKDSRQSTPSSLRGPALSEDSAKELEQARELIEELKKQKKETDKAIEEQLAERKKVEEELLERQKKVEEYQKSQTGKWESFSSGAVDFSKWLDKAEEKQNALIKKIEEDNKNFKKKIEEDQQELKEQVEKTSSQQLQLDRKIDKALHDRTRMLRKMERIEEAVIETRDALNARAMVLLSDQNKKDDAAVFSPSLGQSRGENVIGSSSAEAQSIYAAQGKPWWKQSMRVNMVSASALVIMGLLGGWIVSEVQKPNFEGLSVPSSEKVIGLPDFYKDDSASDIGEQATLNQQDSEKLEQSAAISNEGSDELELSADVESVALAENSETSAGVDVEALEEAVETAAAKSPEEQSDPVQVEQTETSQSGNFIGTGPLEHDDIGTIDLNDEAQLLAAIDKNADALAAQLNEIETGGLMTSKEDMVKNSEESSEDIFELDTVIVANIPSPFTEAEAKRFEEPNKNLPEAVQIIEKSALEGVPEAQHDLAAIYTAGHGGVEQDYQKAAYWFEKAAQNGVANARYNLGVLYHQGLGIDQDLERALIWYDAAANLGHPEAQYNLGIAYIEGIGVSYDPQKAAVFFEKATQGGVVEASYNLGLIYENGLLGEAKPDMALMWYKIAADKGSPEAKAALEQLARVLNISIEEVRRIADSMTEIHKDKIEGTKQKATKAEEPAARTVLASSSQSKEQSLVALVQEYLVQQDLYPGPADGVNGPLTTDAIKTYQELYGLNPTGEINDDLLEHMIANSFDGSSALDLGSREF